MTKIGISDGSWPQVMDGSYLIDDSQLNSWAEGLSIYRQRQTDLSEAGPERAILVVDREHSDRRAHAYIESLVQPNASEMALHAVPAEPVKAQTEVVGIVESFDTLMANGKFQEA